MPARRTDYAKRWRAAEKLADQHYERGEFFLSQLQKVLKFTQEHLPENKYNELLGILGLPIPVPPKAEEGIILNP